MVHAEAVHVGRLAAASAQAQPRASTILFRERRSSRGRDDEIGSPSPVFLCGGVNHVFLVSMKILNHHPSVFVTFSAAPCETCLDVDENLREVHAFTVTPRRPDPKERATTTHGAPLCVSLDPPLTARALLSVRRRAPAHSRSPKMLARRIEQYGV